MPEPPEAIVCMRVSDGPTLVPGATADLYCNKCGEEIRLAPSSFKILEMFPETQLLCTQCVIERLKQEKPEVSEFQTAKDWGIEL